jgi:eukaryotic-like serine/threonine-protein kinase
MALAAGTLLGPYEILTLLGVGGMGEVYRARDTRLDRDVAIKILSAELSADTSRKQRFEREAKVISSLNHPNICVLYDVGNQNGTEYLVMECIEGETLAKRLERGELPTEQMLKIGTEIAGGLDKAHRSGVIHRDLKPGNIMLTKTGAKLLDFGLAKPAVSPSNAITMSGAASPTPVTEQGIIVGTFQYMSPEQVEGKELDGRSDIFSLGAVLYEMLTGQRAFQGKSQLSVASAILDKEPTPLTTVKPLTPPLLDHIIRRCLAKDPDERWQTARDLALELKWTAETVGQAEPLASTRQPRTRWRWLAVVAVVLLGFASALAAFLYRGKAPLLAAPVRFEIPVPAGSLNFTLSPNGRQLAILAAGPDGRRLIWIRALDSLETRPLPGTENVYGPHAFWSPDGRFVAFQLGNKLKRIDISGGPPQTICDTPVSVIGGAWNKDDIIIFGTDGNGIMQVSAGGGVPTFLTTTGGRNEIHAFPSFLSDGRHFTYLRAPEDSGIYIGSLDARPEQQSSKRILATSLMAVYASSSDSGSGRLLFMRDGTLLSQMFDERRLEPLGEPSPVVEQVGTFLLSASFSASANGVLAYRAGKSAIALSGLRWYDRQGKVLGDAGEPGTYSYSDLALSPDVTRVAATRIDPKSSGAGQVIWLLDLTRIVSARFTFDLSMDVAPAWSPDGSRVAYAAWRVGRTGIYQKAANGAGQEQVLVCPTDDAKFPNHWSRDGRFLLYTQQDAKTNTDLWVLPLRGDGVPSGKPMPFANSEFREGQGQFSPDTHWIAYASDESGRVEVYVQPFPTPPGGGSKTPVSREGGNQPRWRRDGKELFYLSLDGKLMAVDVTEGSIFKAGSPKPLFQLPVTGVYDDGNLQVFRWDTTPDGKRFLINTAKTSSEPLTMILNWTAELKQK